LFFLFLFFCLFCVNLAKISPVPLKYTLVKIALGANKVFRCPHHVYAKKWRFINKRGVRLMNGSIAILKLPGWPRNAIIFEDKQLIYISKSNFNNAGTYTCENPDNYSTAHIAVQIVGEKSGSSK